MTGRETIDFVCNWQHVPGGHVLWTGQYWPNGYGRYVYRGVAVLAHRFWLEQRLGRKLLPGMVAAHREDCPLGCILHVTEQSQSENIRSAWNVGKMKNPKSMPVELWESIKADMAAGMRQVDIAKKLGIRPGVISARKYEDKRKAQRHVAYASAR